MVEYEISRQQFENAPTGSIRDGFGEGLLELGKSHWNVVALSADLGGSVRMTDFQTQYPDRFFEVGVAEQNLMGVAAGLAKEGLIPFAGSFAAFSPGRNYDQIRVSVCYSNRNVKIVGSHGGISVGPDGATHQMCEDVAMMRALPNMHVYVPSDQAAARAITKLAATYDHPVYIRLSRASNKTLLNEKVVRLQEMIRLKRGTDVTLVSNGLLMERTMALAWSLEDAGISAEVLCAHSVKPLEAAALVDCAAATKHVVTIEEHQIYGGLGSAVAEVLSQQLPTPLQIIGIEDTFGESGEADDLLDKYGFAVATLHERVEHFLTG